MSLEDDVLAEITPTDAERRRVEEAAAALEATLDDALAGRRLPGRARVQGSVAKDTWLQGSADLDCFLLMDPSLDEAALKKVATSVAATALEDRREKYAQHPYVLGTFRGLAVDLVPAYAVTEAGAKMSAVDRTPFHTAWVKTHLDADARAQVRLFKQWCKGTGVYGAETAIGGLSGYLVEILVHHFGGFASVLDWLAAGAQGRRIAPVGEDEVDDDVSPLVVVDPVDPARNCAAAVQGDVLERAVEAARAYRERPGRRFFFPAPPRAEDARTLHDALSGQGIAWLAVLVRPVTDRLDIVFPQFQRAARQAAEAVERAGWAVHRLDVASSDDEDEVLIQWVASDDELPPIRVQHGPPETADQNARKFRAKWDGHDDAASKVRVDDGRLAVDLHVRRRTAAEFLHASLPDVLPGKHVQAAWKNGHKVFDDPSSAPEAWAPRVAVVVLDRRPWQR